MGLLLSQKISKYRAVPTIVNGIRFASKSEAKDYSDLNILLEYGKIKDLELQPKYDLLVNNIKIGTYKADFRFYDTTLGEWRVVDRKGFDTALSKRSRKHVKAQYGIDIEIWKK